jgi:hypothetical protein
MLRKSLAAASSLIPQAAAVGQTKQSPQSTSGRRGQLERRPSDYSYTVSPELVKPGRTGLLLVTVLVGLAYSRGPG